jgi:hypothetical protein
MEVEHPLTVDPAEHDALVDAARRLPPGKSDYKVSSASCQNRPTFDDDDPLTCTFVLAPAHQPSRSQDGVQPR